MVIYIGANSAKLSSFAMELLSQCQRAENPEGQSVEIIDVPLYAHIDGGDQEEVTLSFSNDDMEDRDDLDADLVLVNIER